MDHSSITQNRRSRRSKVLMAASIESGLGSCGVTLRDLSADGALIDGDEIPASGSAVVFRKNELTVRGTVAWVSDRRAGIAFDSPLDPETVLRHIPSPKQRIRPEFKRPGFAPNEITPQERQWLETFIYNGRLPVLES